MNPECPVSSNPTASGSSTTQQTIKTQYEIMVSLSDHTGTVENCRFAENCAETMCGCKVSSTDTCSMRHVASRTCCSASPKIFLDYANKIIYRQEKMREPSLRYHTDVG